jgi:hypothetical integral membrane protein (TIGR02206 family)
VRVLGPGHVAWLTGIAVVAVLLARVCRQHPTYQRAIRFLLGAALAGEELFRYAHDGIHFPNKVPLHLCTVALWMAVVACFTLAPLSVEFAYFVGLPGSTLALLTPDLRAAWNSYDSIRYFFEHGCLVITIVVLVFGKIAPIRTGAAFRAHNMWFVYGVSLLIFNRVFGTNYLYLSHKPVNPSLLDYLGPWPVYILFGELVAITMFWLLWLPVRPKQVAERARSLPGESALRME